MVVDARVDPKEARRELVLDGGGGGGCGQDYAAPTSIIISRGMVILRNILHGMARWIRHFRILRQRRTWLPTALFLKTKKWKVVLQQYTFRSVALHEP
jgi:hypothetical protein